MSGVSESTLPPDPQHLDAASVRRTVERLGERITARFPDRNLGRVPGQLIDVIDDMVDRSLVEHSRTRWLRWLCNAGIAAVGLGLAAALAVVVSQATGRGAPQGWDWLGVFESLVNDMVFAALAIFFLWALPARIERRTDLATLHRLRSLAHVIDMHQLTKDPDRLRSDFRETPASIPNSLTAMQLSNYLDYCSELLSLVAKTAALFAERTTDPAVISAIEGIEDLTTGLSRKIWAKIALLPRIAPA